MNITGLCKPPVVKGLSLQDIFDLTKVKFWAYLVVYHGMI
jgi:hypothetical protein